MNKKKMIGVAVVSGIVAAGFGAMQMQIRSLQEDTRYLKNSLRIFKCMTYSNVNALDEKLSYHIKDSNKAKEERV